MKNPTPLETAAFREFDPIIGMIATKTGVPPESIKHGERAYSLTKNQHIIIPLRDGVNEETIQNIVGKNISFKILPKRSGVMGFGKMDHALLDINSADPAFETLCVNYQDAVRLKKKLTNHIASKIDIDGGFFYIISETKGPEIIRRLHAHALGVEWDEEKKELTKTLGKDGVNVPAPKNAPPLRGESRSAYVERCKTGDKNYWLNILVPDDSSVADRIIQNLSRELLNPKTVTPHHATAKITKVMPSATPKLGPVLNPDASYDEVLKFLLERMGAENAVVGKYNASDTMPGIEFNATLSRDKAETLRVELSGLLEGVTRGPLAVFYTSLKLLNEQDPQTQSFKLTFMQKDLEQNDHLKAVQDDKDIKTVLMKANELLTPFRNANSLRTPRDR